MASKPPDPRIARTRQVLHAALVSLITEKPFANVTVQDIAARAGVGHATFYRHYPTRDALLADVADGLIMDLAAVIAPMLQSRDTAAAARTLTEFVAANRALCSGLLVGASDAMRRTLTDRATAIGRHVGTDTPTWLPPALGVVHAVGATLAILGWWLEHDAGRSNAEIATILDRLVFAPLSIT